MKRTLTIRLDEVWSAHWTRSGCERVTAVVRSFAMHCAGIFCCGDSRTCGVPYSRSQKHVAISLTGT